MYSFIHRIIINQGYLNGYSGNGQDKRTKPYLNG